jgi:hypothetical protein
MGRLSKAASGFAAISLVASLAFTVGASPPAAAQWDGFHGYAIACPDYCYNNQVTYTGMRTDRYDDNNVWWYGDDCQDGPVSSGFILASNPVLQDEWVDIAGYGGTTYWEFGTDQQCEQSEWWFAAETYENSYNLLWSQQITGTAFHSFWLYRANSGGNEYWAFQIDSTPVVGPIWNAWTSNFINMGIESYNDQIVFGYQNSPLYQSTWGDEQWSLWSNTQVARNDTDMCTDVLNDYTVNTAIGEGC